MHAYLSVNQPPNLISSNFVGDVNPNDVVKLDLVLKLNDLGSNQLVFIVNSSNDADIRNNYYYESFRIVPKSLIMNLENETIEGYLIININKYNYSSYDWILYREIINDFRDNNIRHIEQNSYLALDKIFNPNNVVITGNGDYTVYIAFLDKNGNIFITSYGEKLESYSYFIITGYGESTPIL